MDAAIAFTVGAMVGGLIGVFFTALCVVGGEEKNERQDPG